MKFPPFLDGARGDKLLSMLVNLCPSKKATSGGTPPSRGEDHLEKIRKPNKGEVPSS